MHNRATDRRVLLIGDATDSTLPRYDTFREQRLGYLIQRTLDSLVIYCRLSGFAAARYLCHVRDALRFPKPIFKAAPGMNTGHVHQKSEI
jgi:hypothetical protein